MTVQLLENIDKILSEGRKLTGSKVIAWHCGRKLKGGRFSTDHIGTGEGDSALGPGIYFATERSVAEMYCRHHREPVLYKVEFPTRDLYSNQTGEPKRLLERLKALVKDLLPRYGVDKWGEGELRLPRGSSLKHGPGMAGDIVRALGGKRAREEFLKIGLKGLWVSLPAGGFEISVFDPSIVTILDSFEMESGTDDDGAIDYSF